MNERIIGKLANDAWVDVPEGQGYGGKIFSKEKFAELIVRECIKLADNEAERFSNLDQEYCAMAMDNYRELVRKHFGVEE